MGSYLACVHPQARAPADNPVSARKQLLTLTGHTNLYPGDVSSMAASPLMHIRAVHALVNPWCPALRLRQTALSIFDGPSFDVTSLHPNRTFTMDPAVSTFSALLMQRFDACYQNHARISCRCGTNFRPICVIISTSPCPIRNPLPPKNRGMF